MTRQFCATEGCSRFACYRNVDNGEPNYTCFSHASQTARDTQRGYQKAYYRRTRAGAGKFDLAYLAGLFDGEGWICIVKTRPGNDRINPRYTLQVGLANTHRGVMQHIVDTFGGRITTKHRRNTQHAPCYEWLMSVRIMERTLIALLPFMHVKQQQARIALAFRRGNITGEQAREQIRALRTPLRQSRL